MRSFLSFQRLIDTMETMLGEALLTTPQTDEMLSVPLQEDSNQGRAYEGKIIDNLTSAFDSMSPSGWKRIDHTAYLALSKVKFKPTSKVWKTYVGGSADTKLIYIHGSTRPSDPDAIITIIDSATMKTHTLGIECKQAKLNKKGDKISQGAPSSTLMYHYDYDSSKFSVSPKLAGVVTPNSAADWTIRLMLRGVEKPIRALIEAIISGSHLTGDMAKYRKVDMDGLRLGGKTGLPLACLKHTWSHLSKTRKLLRPTNISSKDFFKKMGVPDHKSLGDFGGFDSSVMNCRLYANKKPPSYYIQVGAGEMGGFYTLGGGDIDCISGDPLGLASSTTFMKSETKLEVRIKAPGSCAGSDAIKEGFGYNLDTIQRKQATGAPNRLKKGDQIDANWKKATTDADKVLDVIDVTRDPASPGNAEIVTACPRLRIQNHKGCELILFTRVVPQNKAGMNLEKDGDCKKVIAAALQNYTSFYTKTIGGGS